MRVRVRTTITMPLIMILIIHITMLQRQQLLVRVLARPGVATWTASLHPMPRRSATTTSPGKCGLGITQPLPCSGGCSL